MLSGLEDISKAEFRSILDFRIAHYAFLRYIAERSRIQLPRWQSVDVCGRPLGVRQLVSQAGNLKVEDTQITFLPASSRSSSLENHPYVARLREAGIKAWDGEILALSEVDLLTREREIVPSLIVTESSYYEYLCGGDLGSFLISRRMYELVKRGEIQESDLAWPPKDHEKAEGLISAWTELKHIGQSPMKLGVVTLTLVNVGGEYEFLTFLRGRKVAESAGLWQVIPSGTVESDRGNDVRKVLKTQVLREMEEEVFGVPEKSSESNHQPRHPAVAEIELAMNSGECEYGLFGIICEPLTNRVDLVGVLKIHDRNWGVRNRKFIKAGWEGERFKFAKLPAKGEELLQLTSTMTSSSAFAINHVVNGFVH